MNRTLLILLLIFSTYTIPLIAQDMHFTWAKQYGSISTSNDIQALTSDNENHVFAFTHFENEFTIDGTIYESPGNKNLLLFSINEDGNTEWVINEGGIDDEYAQKLTCDADGNVYIIGKFHSSMVMNGVSYESNGSFDMYMAKYSNDGQFVWAKVFGGPNSESLVSIEIKYSRIVLAGRFYDYTVIEDDTLFSQAGTDVFVSKFDLDGNLINSMTIGGESVDMVSDLAIDSEANIYITGDFYKDIYFDEDIYFEVDDILGIYIAKYDASLNLVWAYQVLGDDLKPSPQLDVSSSGECSLSGGFTSTVNFDNIHLSTAPSDEDVYLAHFSDEGVVNWAQRYYSSSMDNIIDMAVDQEGDTYLAGHYLSSINFNGLILNYSLC